MPAVLMFCREQATVCCRVLETGTLWFLPIALASFLVAISGPMIGFFGFKRVLDSFDLRSWQYRFVSIRIVTFKCFHRVLYSHV